MKEILIDIANLSFTIDTIEEVGMSKIFVETLYDKPTAYSVSWSEWVKNNQGDTIQAKTEAQTYKTKIIQRFESYDLAREFFIKKIDEISLSYKEGGIKK